MQFDEHRIGEYRIYAGAVEGPLGDGYTAALIVERQAPGASMHEVFRDEHLACGHRWPTAAEALAYAMQKARSLVRHREASARSTTEKV